MMTDHVAGRVARQLIFTGVAGEISVPEFGGIFGKEFVAVQTSNAAAKRAEELTLRRFQGAMGARS